ncbi:MAG: hypothetical protein V2I37_04650, partial [Marinilabiliaceae bacterium]|nr:hypothetical protein [Marinilabiliaceae bacterium]
MIKNIYKTWLTVITVVLFSSLTGVAQTQTVKTISACRLFADIENTSAVLGYIPAGKEVEVIEILDDYLLVKYEDMEGLILKDKTDNGAEMLSPAQQNQVQQKQVVNPGFIEDRLMLLSEKYGTKSGKAIYEHKIWKGMDHNMIRDSWGKPLRVSREVKTSGTVEIWTYRKSWLLLRNGILSEWGPNR